jgi:hypothetical protein
MRCVDGDDLTSLRVALLLEHLTGNDTGTWKEAVFLSAFVRDYGQFFSKATLTSPGVHESAFDEARLMSIHKTNDLDLDGEHHFSSISRKQKTSNCTDSSIPEENKNRCSNTPSPSNSILLLPIFP